jgi:hypothetical protein
VDYLKERLPDSNAFVKICNKEPKSPKDIGKLLIPSYLLCLYFGFTKSNFFKDILLSDFVEQRVYSKTPLYAMDIGLAGTCLEKEIVVPSIFMDNVLADPQIKSSFLVALVGGPGTYCGLHTDTCNIHSYIWLLSGSKLYYLFPPESHADDVFGYRNHFPAIIEKELKEKIERLGGMVIALHEGDIVFIPAGWWHAATNITDTIAWGDSIINFSNIKAVLSCYRERPEEFKRTCLNMKDLLDLMVKRATTIEEIAILLGLLQPNEFPQVKQNLQKKMKAFLK